MNRTESWDTLKGYLPPGWEEAARETGAMRRSRNVRTAEELLAVNMVYLTEIGSFQGTSVLLRLTKGIDLNKNAVRHRIQRSWPWLQWMAEKLCRTQGFLMPKPSWLGGRRVILVDASDIALQGSQTSDYRLHYAISLFELTCQCADLTGTREGETLCRHSVSHGDIIVADRIYGTIRGMEHVRRAGGDFLLRLRSRAFTLYDAHRKPVDLSNALSTLAPLEAKALDCWYRTKEGAYEPLRIVAMRKDELAEQDALRRIKRRASRKQQPPAKPDTVALAAYIILATSLTQPPEQILALYRARWQIEQVFFRLKSLFNLGEVPGKNPDSVKAWFYGKLFVAALCETIALSLPFPPNGLSPEPSPRTAGHPQPLE